MPPTGGGTTTNQAPATGGVDISGPCDEAEHANDPRCTGAATGDRADNSGPGSVHSGRDDDRGDDHGGNSGPGRGGDDDDGGDDHGGNSGHGGGGDDD